MAFSIRCERASFTSSRSTRTRGSPVATTTRTVRLPSVDLHRIKAASITLSMDVDSNLSCTSPASRRAISAASPTSRFNRSLSSLMTTRRSCRCASLSPALVKRFVTEALIDVSGVRRLCVTDSVSAVRKRSPSRVASVCPSCSIARARSMATAINVPIASSVWRERVEPEIPRLPIGRTPSRTGTKQRLFGTSITGSSRATMAFRLSISRRGITGPERYTFCFSESSKAAAPTSKVFTICAGIRLSS